MTQYLAHGFSSLIILVLFLFLYIIILVTGKYTNQRRETDHVGRLGPTVNSNAVSWPWRTTEATQDLSTFHSPGREGHTPPTVFTQTSLEGGVIHQIFILSLSFLILCHHPLILFSSAHKYVQLFSQFKKRWGEGAVGGVEWERETGRRKLCSFSTHSLHPFLQGQSSNSLNALSNPAASVHGHPSCAAKDTMMDNPHNASLPPQQHLQI